MSEPLRRTLSLHPADPTRGSDPPVFKDWLPCLPAVCPEAGHLTLLNFGFYLCQIGSAFASLQLPLTPGPRPYFPAGNTGRPACVRFPCCSAHGPRPRQADSVG